VIEVDVYNNITRYKIVVLLFRHRLIMYHRRPRMQNVPRDHRDVTVAPRDVITAP